MTDLRQEAMKAIYTIRDAGHVMEERAIHRYIEFIESHIRDMEVTIQELSNELEECENDRGHLLTHMIEQSDKTYPIETLWNDVTALDPQELFADDRDEYEDRESSE